MSDNRPTQSTTVCSHVSSQSVVFTK